MRVKHTVLSGLFVITLGVALTLTFQEEFAETSIRAVIPCPAGGQSSCWHTQA